MVDWDEDGLVDVIVGEFSGRVSWYRNPGPPGTLNLVNMGYLQVGDSTLIVDYDSTPCIDDWNGDGRKDLLVGAIDGRVWLYLNEGTNAAPVFPDTAFVTLANGDTLQVSSRSAPQVMDLDGDGVKDLLSGDGLGPALFFRNRGTNPNPQLETAVLLTVGPQILNPGLFSRFAALDWDGDGALDLVAGSNDDGLKLYLNIPVTGPHPSVYVNFQGPVTIPDSGAVLNLTCALSNFSPSTLDFDVWTAVRGPDYRIWHLGPQAEAVTLAPGAELWREPQPHIPAWAPPGSYRVCVYAGDFERRQVCDGDTFYFNKVLDGESWTPLLPSGLTLNASPNPFNPWTAVSYELRAASHVRLRIYDTAGREVATLVDGWREAGIHQATFDGSGLASGVYFARLETAAGSVTTKLLFMH
ncbi:MAG: T9SS C-terminal target domain-containing protein [Candidatus Zixiibacteriota bacterium]|nr:MAG: T9SS C-terminal target domain-containing protein [candidate division Zixibacteria bacterium]